jgi:hypothetical protein
MLLGRRVKFECGFLIREKKKEGMLSICRFVSVNVIYLLRHLNSNIGVFFCCLRDLCLLFMNKQLVLTMIINIK